MTQGEALNFSDKDEWRSWLDKNHLQSNGVWIIIQKKSSKISGPSYEDSINEALCYGWIDGRMKRIDQERFILWFSPRRMNSLWSLANKNRALRLIEEKCMMPAGFEKIEEAKKNGRWMKAYESKGQFEVPADLVEAFYGFPEAYENFLKFPDSSRFIYIHWINEAKRSRTRERRIRIVIERSMKNLKPGNDT
jgi:uncharacterized protein YdeI (YjbR/CyaY-like superfamily)